MGKTKKAIFLAVMSLLFNVAAFSQIILGSSGNTGCAPASFNFTVMPPGATSYQWDFGNGQSATGQTPSQPYQNPGIYNVSCTVTMGASQTIYTISLQVFPTPTANFVMTADPVGCAPRSVTFANTSQPGAAATISTSAWIYNDGTPAEIAVNPVHSFSYSGNYNITLQVVNNHGCSGAVTIGTVSVSDPPKVVIGSNPSTLGSCSPPFNVTFNGNSSQSGSPLGGGLTYTWNFGNSQTSNSQNPPPQTYASLGTYTVSLAVTDNNNCSATAKIPFSVNQPTINAVIPPTVCVGSPFPFTLTTTQSQAVINYGDGLTALTTVTPGTHQYALHTYTAAGNYTVSISTTVPGTTCTATQLYSVYAETVTAGMQVTPNFSCQKTVIMQPQGFGSSNVTKYDWNIIELDTKVPHTSTLTNPSFTITQGSLNPYTVFGVKIASVTLIVTTNSGCKASLSTTVALMQRPTAKFEKNKMQGCSPLAVRFWNTSVSHSLFPISSYTWCDGASPPNFTIGTVPPPIVSPSFTYAVPGIYRPYLVVKTSNGCEETSFLDTVIVSTAPQFIFSVAPSTVCATQGVAITTNFSGSPPVDHWHVQSNDGLFSHCISNSSPQWTLSNVGTHTLQMHGFSKGCKGTSSVTHTVTSHGPRGAGRFETDCANRRVVTFYPDLQEVQAWQITFGDNTQSPVFNTSVASTVIHTYPVNSGIYTAVLSTTNTMFGCASHTFAMPVTIANAQASFAVASVVCASVNIFFDGSTSKDVMVSCERGYNWFVDNDPPKETDDSYMITSFSTAGTHTVRLMVTDVNGCSDQFTRVFRVSSVEPSFSIAKNPACLSDGSITVVNTTTVLVDPVTQYAWDFGDNSNIVNTMALNVMHAYSLVAPPSQTFAITLQAINSQNCVNAVTRVITIGNPAATLAAQPSQPCVGSPVVFSAPPANSSYTFNFGEGVPVVAGTRTAAYTYTNALAYVATLTVQDAMGCRNTGTLAVNVQSVEPAAFIFSSPNATGTNNICAGSIINYTATTLPTFPIEYKWSFVPLTTSLVTNFIPATAAGGTVLTLTVSTVPNGCKSVVSRTLTIYRASADLNLDRTVVCTGSRINFSLKDTSTVGSWTWYFGDGDTLEAQPPGAPPVVSHTYTYFPQPAGNTTVTLYYFSAGKACKFAVSKPITVIGVFADFKRNNELAKADSMHCVHVQDVFTDSSTSMRPLNYAWNFDAGATGSGKQATHTFTNAGTYNVTLTVTEPVNGCSNSKVKQMTIFPLPEFTVTSPDTVCVNTIFSLQAEGTGLISYTWQPAALFSASNSVSTTASSSVALMTYTLFSTDINGCVNSAEKTVRFQMPLQRRDFDTTVVIGEPIPLDGSLATSYHYTWTPVTDLSCTFCYFPVSTTTTDITYTLQIRDSENCFNVSNYYSIHVLPKASLDVPTAFTPNGDGVNDIIYVSGWGLRKLNYFKIFNRWGELVFETNDLATGWNGFFNGALQNMETYIYQASAQSWISDEPVEKSGTFKLLR